MFEADVADIIGDGTHTITIGLITKPCSFSEADEATAALARSGGAEQITVHALVMVNTADFPSVKGKDAVTVNKIDPVTAAVITTTAYSVWRRQRIHEGAVTELWLRLT
jgi:hypothetical protein